MDFSRKLRNYAKLITLHGLNVQNGQLVSISTEMIHKELALLVAEECYLLGAKFVNINFHDSRLTKIRINCSNPEFIDFIPDDFEHRYKQILNEHGAYLSIVGPEEPDILKGVNTELVNRTRVARYNSMKDFYEKGIGQSNIHWCVVAGATPKWAKQIWTDLSEDVAYKNLWDQIFRICRVDQENFLELWQEHDKALKSNAEYLNSLNIEKLHFKGPDTDLIVGLSNLAIFKAGSEKGPRGVNFEANLPTEECFTTPNSRITTGKVKITRPVIINGITIKNLQLEFNNGEITSFSATEGQETFETYIKSDLGADKLGEVALVSTDSPIFQSGIVFNEILFDENAACHIAIGSAYQFCIKNYEYLSKEEIERIGFNESSVHTDLMISSESTSVDAIAFSGTTHNIIDRGKWNSKFTRRSL